MPNVLLATSEAVPFAKTGGLADVCGTLPAELNRLGSPTTVIMPAYRCVHNAGFEITDTGLTLDIPVGQQLVHGRLLQTTTDTNVTVYFVDQPEYFDRPALYGEDGTDYRDNCERFVFFSRAVLEAIRALELEVDLVHCNDWQTALIPILLDAEYRGTHGYESLASVLTIHNLAYQGRFWHWDMLLTGLDWKYFDWRRLEFYGDLCLLKGGIVYADTLTTVSPKYAEEIQSAPLGCGLENVLHNRREHLHGILNGVDYTDWNPALDPHVTQQYSIDSWQDGKAACKAALQREMGLTVDPNIPMLGFVGRLAEQKGVDLIAQVMQNWVRSQDVQWVILGTGQPELEQRLLTIAKQAPSRVAANIAFSNQMAHQIEAGADMFLMPSRYEPCGLNQLYSLKYGTCPVVHSTGGLHDTVVNCTEESLEEGRPTGFAFHDYSSSALEGTLHWAVNLYRNRRDDWNRIVENGMLDDWSWQRSASSYVAIYKDTISRAQMAAV